MKFTGITAAASLCILASGAAAQTVDTTATPISLAEAIRLAQRNSIIDSSGARQHPHLRSGGEAILCCLPAELVCFSRETATERRPVRYAGQPRSIHGKSDELLDRTSEQPSAVRRWSSFLRPQALESRRRRSRSGRDSITVSGRAPGKAAVLQHSRCPRVAERRPGSDSAGRAAAARVVAAASRRGRYSFGFAAICCRGGQRTPRAAHGAEQPVGCQRDTHAARRIASDCDGGSIRHARSDRRHSESRRARAPRDQGAGDSAGGCGARLQLTRAFGLRRHRTCRRST